MASTDRPVPRNGQPQPVTVLVERRVLESRQEEFRWWADGILAEAAGFSGYLGGGVLRPSATDDRWHVVYRFADPASLQAWETSPHKKRCTDRGQDLHEPVRERHLTTMDDLFHTAGPSAPARWKLTIVAAAAVYPLSFLADLLLIPHIGLLPPPLRNAVIALFFSLALTYLLLPALSRLLRPWLHGNGNGNRMGNRTDAAARPAQTPPPSGTAPSRQAC